ncbi:MAG: hypothetical protein R3Y40_03125 [Eubacteriales bacterium]
MSQNRLKKSKFNIFSKISILTVATLCLFVMLYYAVGTIETTSIEEKEKTIEDLVMRSAIHCYSLEGAYPQDLDYLLENYNLNIDTENYIVHYEIFATNIAPDITVIYNASQGGT